MSTIVYDQDFYRDYIPNPDEIRENLEEAIASLARGGTTFNFRIAGTVEIEIELDESKDPGIAVIA